MTGADGQREVTFFETTQAAEAEENRIALHQGSNQVMIAQPAEVGVNRTTVQRQSVQPVSRAVDKRPIEDKPAEDGPVEDRQAENALTITNVQYPISMYCDICRMSNHTTEQCGKKRNFGKRCEYCGQDFHTEMECKKRRRDRHQQKTMTRWHREYSEPTKMEC